MTNLDIQIEQTRDQINKLEQIPTNLTRWQYLSGQLDGLLLAKMIVEVEQKERKWVEIT